MRIVPLFLVSSTLLSGCQTVVTLNPIVPDSAAITDDRLLGTWREVSDSTRVTIRRPRLREYEMAFTDDQGHPQLVDGRLGRKGGRLVLDLSPGTDSASAGELTSSWPHAPTHVLVVVEFAEDEVRFLSPSGDSIKSYLTTGRIPLAFTEVQNGDLVVGGSTEDLWRQLGRFLAHPGMVDSTGSTILRRLPPH